MKQFIAKLMIFLLLILPATSHAFYYQGKCLSPQGKFKKCSLDFSKSSSFKITFNDFAYSSMNREILGKDISNISVGERAQKRWAAVGGAIYALGPLGALFLLWKKKSTVFNVEYRQGKETNTVLFGVNKKLGPEVSMRLQTVSGQNVEMPPAGKK